MSEIRYYHGTTHIAKARILFNGFERNDIIYNGKHFGNGAYFTDDINTAYSYGVAVVEVEIDEKRLKNFKSMSEYNDYSIQSLAKGGSESAMETDGYIGFHLTGPMNDVIVYVFELDQIKIVKKG